jgi:putative Mg2+ transporter-C (MgtC) family protein
VPDLSQFLRDPQVEALLRVLLAGGLAALIGLEREMEGKAAGLRTYMLVGMGAAAFTVIGTLVYGAGDPASRIGQGIVTGIGFLGAGVILQMKRRVIGLTTAAGIWASAAVGMSIGGGLYIVGIGTAVAIFLVLQATGVERRLRSVADAKSPQEGASDEDSGD